MEKESKELNLIEEAKSLGFIIFIALLIRIFLVEPFFIPSPSMNNTLLEGDYLFATKYNYGYSKHSLLFFTPESLSGRVWATEPERGDVVIFRPPHDMDTRYIKRLIGLPGDKVQLKEGIVYINDKALERKYVTTLKGEGGYDYKQYIETMPNGCSYEVLQRKDAKDPMVIKYNDTKVFEIPEGQYFFMGDNRNNSNDSRFSLGFVPFENFIAKARFIYFSQGEYLWVSDKSIVEQFAQVYHWIVSIRPSRMFRDLYSL